MIRTAPLEARRNPTGGGHLLYTEDGVAVAVVPRIVRDGGDLAAVLATGPAGYLLALAVLHDPSTSPVLRELAGALVARVETPAPSEEAPCPP